MLQLFLGRSGTGKTTALYEEMHRLATENEAPIFFLVPEQASFENERRLLENFGPVLSQRVQVLSFTRLAEIVFRNIGGVAGKTMDTTLSLLLMSQALYTLSDSLTVYRRSAGSADYLKELLSFFAECKQSGLSPRLLEESSQALTDGILRKKLQETASIFTAYEALAAQSQLTDPLDMLTILARRLSECSLFDGAHVFVDSFVGFTKQEMDVLEQLLSRTATVTVALCTDGLSEPNEANLFAESTHTATRLINAAQKHHVSVKKPRMFTENKRTTSLELQALEAGCYAPAPVVFENPTTDVCITPCADRSEECRYAARQIRRLLRENGGFYRDFTVVARNSNDYKDLLQSALQQEGISCIMDMRESVLTQPLIVLLESALSVIRNGFNSDDVLRLVKTGLLGFSVASSSLLENYVFIWNIHGKQWKQPFKNHPDGLTAVTDDNSTRRLDYLNILRHRLIAPLCRFQSLLEQSCNGTDFSKAVWQLLNDWHVPRMVRFQASRLAKNGEHVLADNQARLWDYTIALLDKFAFALTEKNLSVERLSDLFHLAVSSDDLGNIPAALDGVIFGSADRIRYTNPKTVIVLGANEGVFPAYPSSGGIITHHERRLLKKAGFPLSGDADSRVMEERFFAYSAVTAPSQRLIVTYAQKVGVEAQQPSSLVETIRHSLTHCRIDTPQSNVSESLRDAFYHLTSLWNENTATAAAYRFVFRELSHYQEQIKSIQDSEKDFSFQNPAVARQLFGENLRLSPSQVEVFHRCAFSYFCQYGLRAKPRKPAELNAAVAGTLVHYVMQESLPTYIQNGIDSCTEDTVKADAEKIVAQYVNQYLSGSAEKDSRFENLLLQLTTLCAQLLWRVVCEFKQSRFVPVDFELPIGRYDENGNGIPPWVIHTPDGTSVQVQGVVDRVDTFEKDGQTYVRIVDYKTGNKVFDMAEITAGINMQMLIYLFSICQNGQARYHSPAPAGVLYLPAKLPTIRVERNADSSEMQRERLKTMKMNGLLLADSDVLEAMEKENDGVFIPANITNSGALSKTSSVATAEQFTWLEQHIQNVLSQMASRLHQGEIGAVPLSGLTDSCRYCEYHDICGHEPEDVSRVLVKKSLQEALSDLKPEPKEECDDAVDK